MKKTKLFLGIQLAFGLVGVAHATDTYFCDTYTGAMTGAVQGADGNPGTAASPKRTISTMQSTINSGANGDRVLVGRGCAWNVDTPLIIRNTTATGTGVTLDAYVSPAWTTSSDSGTWTSVGTNTLTDSTKSWTTNQFAEHGLELVGPFGSALYVTITSNTATTLTLSENWRTGHQPQTAQTNKAYTISAPRPKFITTTTDGGGNIQFTGSNTANGPYTIQNIAVIGPYQTTASRSNFGIFINRGAHDITFDHVLIGGAGSTGLYLGDSTDQNETAGGLRNVTFKNGQIYDNVEQGTLGGVLNQRLLYSSVDNNGYFSTCGNGCHNIYWSNELNAITGRSGYGYQLIGNTITNNSKTNGTTCAATSVGIHGSEFGVLFEDNAVLETSSTYGGGCWGIIVNSGYATVEGFRGVVFRGNTIVNMPIPIGVTAAPYVLIENNNIEFNVSGGDFFGITIPVNNSGGLNSGDLADGNATVRNNTFNLTQGNSNAALINFGEYNMGPGTGVSVFNNLGFIGSSVNATHSCWVWGTQTLAGAFGGGWDYNLCYQQGGNGRWNRSTDTVSYANLAAAQAGGADTHGLSSDPLFANTRSAANNWSCDLQSSSPAKNAGSTANGSPNAFGGRKVVGVRDIGACDQ